MSTATLTDAQRVTLLDVAARSIATVLTSHGRERWTPDASEYDATLQRPAAVFVTLLSATGAGERLLGCIGTLEAREPMVQAVARYAVAAGFADPRLPSITARDFETMTIKVSVLSERTPIDASSYDDLVAGLVPGRDGLVVEAPGAGATFLPSVWEQLPEAAAFVAHLWQKAGLRPGAWPRNIACFRYTTEEFGADGPRAL